MSWSDVPVLWPHVLQVARAGAMAAQSTSDGYNFLPVEITEGPMKGEVVLRVQPKKPFRLMDLPAELRVSIYELLFLSSEFVELVRPYHDKKNCIECRRGVVHGRKRFGNINILRASKGVYVEALPVLYGANTFDPSLQESASMPELRRFLSTIGSSANHVKHVDLNYYLEVKRVLMACNIISHLPRLEQITFGPGCWTTLYVDSPMVGMCELRRSRESKDYDGVGERLPAELEDMVRSICEYMKCPKDRRATLRFISEVTRELDFPGAVQEMHDVVSKSGVVHSVKVSQMVKH